MGKEFASVDYNSFVAGLNTDASPLTFPKNASLDEDNFVLNRDGSRNRRLGMDYESDHVDVPTTFGKDGDPSDGMVFNTYRWEDVGGITGKHFLVVQCGTQIDVFDLDIDPISSGKLLTVSLPYTSTYPSVGSFDNYNKLFSFSSVQGDLVVAYGSPLLLRLDYDILTNTISQTSYSLSVRDLFGLSVTKDSVNMRTGNGVTKRYSTSSYGSNGYEKLVYNLRNQSFGTPRANGNDEALADPLQVFMSNQSKFPSHADSVNVALYEDTSDTGGRTLKRFFVNDLVKNPIGTFHSAVGHFIIDALDRGQSRLDSVNSMYSEYSDIDTIPPWPSNTPDQDITPGGATVVQQFAGRMFYAGFSNTVVDGDNQSPKMGSMVLFSKLVQNKEDLSLCYQEADPTSIIDSSIIDTDGGFVSISGAHGIISMIDMGNSLLIIAENGVWRLVGGTETGFAATAYIVEKVTDIGTKSPNSVVVVDNTVLYWADQGIYHVRPNDSGQYVSENVTKNRIQTLYDEIPTEYKILASGEYDSVENKIRWTYNTRLQDISETKELVLDLTLTAYYTNTIYKVSGSVPKVVTLFKDNPFKIVDSNNLVAADEELVVVGSDSVIIKNTSRRSISRELGYVIVTAIGTPNTYTFGTYKDVDFIDFKSFDSTGVDAYAYIITGYESLEEFQRRKQVNRFTTKFKRTESGFIEDGDDFTPLTPSSCLVQAQWGWQNSSSGNRWGREFQAYRYTRHYIPDDVNDSYDTGALMVDTRHKIRGHGKTVSFLFKTEPAKDCHIYGWSMVMSVNSKV